MSDNTQLGGIEAQDRTSDVFSRLETATVNESINQSGVRCPGSLHGHKHIVAQAFPSCPHVLTLVLCSVYAQNMRALKSRAIPGLFDFFFQVLSIPADLKSGF